MVLGGERGKIQKWFRLGEKKRKKKGETKPIHLAHLKGEAVLAVTQTACRRKEGKRKKRETATIGIWNRGRGGKWVPKRGTTPWKIAHRIEEKKKKREKASPTPSYKKAGKRKEKKKRGKKKAASFMARGLWKKGERGGTKDRRRGATDPWGVGAADRTVRARRNPMQSPEGEGSNFL